MNIKKALKIFDFSAFFCYKKIGRNSYNRTQNTKINIGNFFIKKG